jgi:glucose-1-phosphate thymidylyltransferase
MSKLIGVVPAAGKGTRLLSLTENTPKALLKLNGKPLIQYTLEALIKLEVTEIIIIIGYQGNEIRRFVESLSLSIPIKILEQKKLNGLPGAILTAKEYLKDSSFIVYPPDNLFTKDQKENLKKHISTGAIITLLYEEKKIDFPRSRVIVSNEEIKEISISQPGSIAKITTGLSFHSSEFIQYLKDLHPTNKGEYEMRDAIKEILAKKKLVIGLPVIGNRLEITSPEDYQNLSQLINENKVLLYS